MTTQTTSPVRLKQNQLHAWLNNWTCLPVFSAQDLRPTLTEKPSKEQLNAWVPVMQEAMENLVQGIIQIRGKLWVIDKVKSCKCASSLSNRFEDWTINLHCVRKNGSTLHTELIRWTFQFIEIQPELLTHPLWTTSNLTINGTPLTSKIYQETQELPAPVQEQLLHQIATEYLQAKIWTPEVAQQWTSCGPRMLTSVTPPSTKYYALYLVAKNTPKPNGTSRTIPGSGTDLYGEFLNALRELAWAWTSALTYPPLGSYPLWIKQKTKTSWAFEPFTFQALSNGLQLDLAAKTPALTELLSHASDQTIVPTSLKPLSSNPLRVVFPFYIKPYWEQVTQLLRTKVDETSFTLSLRSSGVPQPLRPPEQSDVAWRSNRSSRTHSTIEIEQQLLAHQIATMAC